MEKFFDQYVDLTAAFFALVLPLLFTIKSKRATGKKTRAIPTYFLFFGPGAALALIFFHLMQISYQAISGALVSKFVYDFRFYSLILLGLAVGCNALLLIKACYGRCYEKTGAAKTYAWGIALFLALTLPLIPLTPIASVPSVAIVLSVIAFAFVNRKKLPIVSVVAAPKEKAMALD